ncbi:MAG: HYR domain-containing protein [Verrucomicrobia bacterium]|nr:HYR domain-containing protein [Verrucomicrobiota bacterium]
MKTKLFSLIAACALALNCATVHASTAYGDLNNCDVINDTGVPCHGFEIEIDDIHSVDITYTYDWNHYGVPKITEDNSNPLHPKVFVRYASAKNPDGTWAAYTAVPPAPIPPTSGHMCTDPSVNGGCEHFGVGYYGVPSAVKYNWLIDDGAGNLIHGPPVYVATPTFVFYPPAGGQVAQVQAAIVPPPPPAPPVLEFGTASWVKEIITSSHTNNPVELKDLVDPDPNDLTAKDWRNGEPDEVEIEWQLFQTEFAAVNGGANGELDGAAEDLANGDEVITRRYEFYKYTGPIDTQSGEALAEQVAPDGLHGVGTVNINGVDVDLSTIIVVGDFIGAQMAGFAQAAPLGLIDHLQDGDINVPYVDRTVVIGGNTPYLATIATGALPNGMSFDQVTGVIFGTPTESGVFTFKIDAMDADNAFVSKTYDLTIAAAPVVSQPPNCNVGGPYTAQCNGARTTVILNGTGSSDPNGAVFTYSWSSDCPGATFDDPTLPAPTLTLDSAVIPETCNVTLVVSNAFGLTSSCTTTVTVVDTTPPTITCPADISVAADQGQCSAIVSFVVQAGDTCSGVNVACNPPSGSAFPVGTTTVSCIATDGAGLTARCSFKVTVHDTQNPAITCPGDIVVSAAAGQCSSNVVFVVSATDNCSVVSLASVPPGGTAFPVGTTTVTSTATDASGNTSSCSFTVTVQDTQPPVIVCPANISVPPDPGQTSAVVTYTVNASDNCSAVALLCNPASGSTFPAGTTTVTCTATDATGNASTCTFTVTVTSSGCANDTTAPTVSFVALQPFKILANPLRKMGQFQLTITDNCDPDALIYISDSVSGFVAGPFHNGDQVEVGEGPLLTPGQTTPTRGSNVASIRLKGDAKLYGVDRSGNTSPFQKLK